MLWALCSSQIPGRELHDHSFSDLKIQGWWATVPTGGLTDSFALFKELPMTRHHRRGLSSPDALTI